MNRDVRSDNRKNSMRQKPTDGFYFEFVHCADSFLMYEASDAAKKCQSKKAEKWREKLG